MEQLTARKVKLYGTMKTVLEQAQATGFDLTGYIYRIFAEGYNPYEVKCIEYSDVYDFMKEQHSRRWRCLQGEMAHEKDESWDATKPVVTVNYYSVGIIAIHRYVPDLERLKPIAEFWKSFQI